MRKNTKTRSTKKQFVPDGRELNKTKPPMTWACGRNFCNKWTSTKFPKKCTYRFVHSQITHDSIMQTLREPNKSQIYLESEWKTTIAPKLYLLLRRHARTRWRLWRKSEKYWPSLPAPLAFNQTKVLRKI